MIRPAKWRDMEAIRGLMRQLSRHEFTDEMFKACYLHNLKHKHILVYEEADCVRGCGILAIHYMMHYSRKSAEIVNLIVDESARGRGIGKALLDEFERIAIENGCVSIEADSGKHRVDAHRFYYREGFVCEHYKFTKGLL